MQLSIDLRHHSLQEQKPQVAAVRTGRPRRVGRRVADSCLPLFPQVELVHAGGPACRYSSLFGQEDSTSHPCLHGDASMSPASEPGAAHLSFRSEAGWLAVLAPLLAQGVADLAQCCLGTTGVEHRRNHVAVLAGSAEHLLDGCGDGRLVTARAALGEDRNMVPSMLDACRAEAT